MAKSVISQSAALARERRKRRKKIVLWMVLPSLGLLVLYLVYVFLHALAYGYKGIGASLFGSVSSLRFVYYWNTSDYGLFTLPESLPRMIFFFAYIVFCLLLGLVLNLLAQKKEKRAYEASYLKLLSEETRILGLTVDYIPEVKPEEEKKENHAYLELTGFEEECEYQFSTSLLSWKGRQGTYLRQGKKRDGFLIEADIPEPKSHAFLQLRTFGKLERKQVDGLLLNTYGFGDIPSLARFTCTTTLGRDIYLVFDKSTAEAISKLMTFLSSDVIMTFADEKLYLFIDGFRLRLPHPLKEPVQMNQLEEQAEVLTALHQALSNLVLSFSDEGVGKKESRANGILSD